MTLESLLDNLVYSQKKGNRDMKKYCVLLSGCGHRDGSEINEAVFSLLSLSQEKIAYDMYAPDWDQYNTASHLTGEEIAPNRNIFEESARIARGELKHLAEFNIEDYAALILPGGYGALKNFTNFPADNGEWEVKPEIAKLILAFYNAKKPIGAICIFPSILAMLFKDKRIKVTTGLDPESKKIINFTKAESVLLDSDEILVDENSLIISTPAFMNDASLGKVYTGISKLVKQIKTMVK